MRRLLLFYLLPLHVSAFAADNPAPLFGWNQVNDEIFGSYYIHPEFQVIKDKKDTVIELKYFLKDLSKKDVMEQRGWVLVDCEAQTYSVKFGWLPYKTPYHELNPDFWAYKDFKKNCARK